MSEYGLSTKNMWPYYAKGNTSPASSKDGSLGKDDFLRILITQLQNQDPMQPLQDKEFIAQMAQFTSVEQLTNMAAEMKLLRQSFGLNPELIGKSVTWMGKDESGAEAEKTGVVDGILLKDGLQYVSVGDEQIAVSALVRIWKAEGA